MSRPVPSTLLTVTFSTKLRSPALVLVMPLNPDWPPPSRKTSAIDTPLQGALHIWIMVLLAGANPVTAAIVVWVFPNPTILVRPGNIQVVAMLILPGGSRIVDGIVIF